MSQTRKKNENPKKFDLIFCFCFTLCKGFVSPVSRAAGAGWHKKKRKYRREGYEKRVERTRAFSVHVRPFGDVIQPRLQQHTSNGFCITLYIEKERLILYKDLRRRSIINTHDDTIC